MRLLIILLFTCSTLLADSEAMPTPRVTVSENAQYIFKQLPSLRDKDYKVIGEPWGAAYELQNDGTFRELWRVEGWYAWTMYLSNDGRYLVRMGNWAHGSEPSPRNLAVAFYDNGKLLADYSTADLVKDKTKVRASVSHYVWLSYQVYRLEDGPESRLLEPRPKLDYANKFYLKTCDGISYTFDATTGKIIEEKKELPPSQPTK